MRKWWPVALRPSAALAAGLACAIVFTVVGLWLRAAFYDRQVSAAANATQVQLNRIADAYRAAALGNPSEVLSGAGIDRDMMFEVVTDSGAVAVRSANLRKWDPSWAGLRPAPVNPSPGEPSRSTVQLGDPARPDRRENTTYTVLRQVVTDVPAAVVEPLNRDGPSIALGLSDPGADSSRRYRLTLYLFVLPWDAQAARGTATGVLITGVPLAVLFVVAIAWIVTGRALRPVEAIRREMAAIGASELDRRVPVPRSGDEVARLAQTTNATLDRLQHALEQQRQFVADASHELRSPVANLRAGIEVALVHSGRADWPEVARQALLDIDRLQKLTADLLLLAERDQAASAPAESVDLAALAAEQAAERAHLSPAGPAVTCTAAGPALVAGQSSQLDRLLRNLLDNACRHASSAVTVTVRTDQDAVVLEVLDDGPGIAPADRERVFERFTRLDDARARDAGGAGLGLAIARGIAQRHGGTLRVLDSETGARFQARFPPHP